MWTSSSVAGSPKCGVSRYLSFFPLLSLSRKFLVELVESYICQKLEACSSGRREFGNTEEGERPPLEAATNQQLANAEKNLCAVVTMIFGVIVTRHVPLC
jgi:hypothetical protein